MLMQSTEDLLVNASNVDPFLSGRATKHLWSHQINVPVHTQAHSNLDIAAHWVGRLSSGERDKLLIFVIQTFMIVEFVDS